MVRRAGVTEGGAAAWPSDGPVHHRNTGTSTTILLDPDPQSCRGPDTPGRLCWLECDAADG